MIAATGRARDEFKKDVKQIIADRVGGLCSNPACRRPTKGSHTDDERVLNLGEACHIRAAAEGGPRYDSAQSSDDRKSAPNGIWLCSSCSTLVDADEQAYPTDLLLKWKEDAEHDARLRIAAYSASFILNAVRQSTEELLAWPQTLADGTWLTRPELDDARNALERDGSQPLVVLGPPGSGKSAFLARMGESLRADGWNIVAVKADRLPNSISTLRHLGEYLGLDLPVAQVLYALGLEARTVLILDQLDALADLVDLHTERLTVLLRLVALVSGFANVRVVCSARDFDFKHDRRFDQLDAKEIHLSAISIGEVDRALAAASVDAQRVPSKLKSLLQIPHWLKVFLKISASLSGPLPESERALLNTVWERLVLVPASVAQENDIATSALSAAMSDREELWLPRALLAAMEPAIQRLLGAGLLASDQRAGRLAFAHQSLFEFARARSFVQQESLVDHVLKRQDALFVRPTIWMALGYLRDVDPHKYRSDLEVLWRSALRHHLRLLLVEFLGRLEAPDEFEAALILPLLQETRWGRLASDAMSSSRGWIARLVAGPVEGVMIGTAPYVAYPILIGALKSDPDAVLELLRRHWDSPDHADRVLNVLMQLNAWSEIARDLADSALTHCSEAQGNVDLLAWQLKDKAPEYAIDLLVRHLTRRFDRLKPTLPRSPPLADDASDQERMRWQFHREPSDSIREFVRSLSSNSVLIELASAAPRHFLEGFLTWLIPILDLAADDDVRHQSYRVDRLIDCSRSGRYVREFPHALRLAAESFAETLPSDFLRFAVDLSGSDLETVHVILTYGLEKLGTTHVGDVVEYLIGDCRRMNLGEASHRDTRTTALITAFAPAMSKDQTQRLEPLILRSESSSESLERTLEARGAAREINRRHRLRLLRALSANHLGKTAAATLDAESRIYGDGADSGGPSGFREIGSPMSAAQMERASDDNIVGLFDALPDSTDSRHPTRWMEGGSVQASRELAGFAKTQPARALKILECLTPERQQTPVSMVVAALAETDLTTLELAKLIVALDGRGFSSEEFRANSARALERRAPNESGLPPEAIALLKSWLTKVPRGPRTKSQPSSDERGGSPPFLFGWGGGYMLPDGSYPILEALLVALLSARPPKTDEWLVVLNEHLDRDENPDVWKIFTHRLRFLSNCDREQATLFVDRLVSRYPEALEWREGVILLAVASWWSEASSYLRSWLSTLRRSSWKHAHHAYGELVTCIAIYHPLQTWAEHEVTTMMSERKPDELTIGATHAFIHLWTEAATRTRAEVPLCSLCRAGEPALDDVIFGGLIRDEFAGDASSVTLLQAILDRGVPVPHESLHAVVPWLAKLIHACPALVHQLADAIVTNVASTSDARPRLAGASEELVDIAVTLQRLPGFRTQGLTLFERLLELNLYGARQALDALDSPRVI